MKERFKIACAALLTMVLVAGCGGGGDSGGNAAKQPAGQPEAAPPSGSTPAPAAGGQTVTLSGKINLEGTAPKRSAIKMSADQVCAKQHTEAALSEDVLVSDTGMLKNVFVYVKTGLEGQTFDTPAEPVVFDQKGCQYTPHVFGIMVNQTFKIMNSDPTLHNIHALPKTGEFNLGMPRQGMSFDKKFPEAQVPVHIKCDVHPWMSAYCGVMTHPFFAVTNENGGFEIKNLPAGTYTIEAWHEKFGIQTSQVTVGTTPTQEVNFTFKATGT